MTKPTKFIITETDEFLTSQGGLALIGMLAQRSGLRDRVSYVVGEKKNGSISTADTLLLRLDAGNDDIENIRVCRKEKVDYIIKRNLHKESIDEWLLDAQALGAWRHPREGKTVYVGKTIRQRDNENMRVVFDVIERTIDRDGNALLLPDIEVHTWWTH
jgi:hypothetical protein